MFHHLDKYAQQDSIVKVVFDHLRNFGLCAIVLGAAAWKQAHVGAGLVAVWDTLVAAILGFVGFGLLWLNHEHLFFKLRSNTNPPLWARIAVPFVYAVVFVELYKYAQAGKAGAS
jgi:hypothetical protein